MSGKNICWPCQGKGRHLEKIDSEDPGAWFTCACCDGTGINKYGEETETKNKTKPKMKTYTGTKTLLAVAMTLGAYNELRGWTIPEGEDPNKEGYLVEYPLVGEDDKPNVEGHDGYCSWTPKAPFEKHYRLNGNLTFGDATLAMKEGKRVCRAGWNGKGMFLFLLPAADGIPTGAIHDPALRQVIETEVGGDSFDALGSIRMFTADKKVLTGWLASQTDILAEDWQIIE